MTSPHKPLNQRLGSCQSPNHLNKNMSCLSSHLPHTSILSNASEVDDRRYMSLLEIGMHSPRQSLLRSRRLNRCCVKPREDQLEQRNQPQSLSKSRTARLLHDGLPAFNLRLCEDSQLWISTEGDLIQTQLAMTTTSPSPSKAVILLIFDPSSHDDKLTCEVFISIIGLLENYSVFYIPACLPDVDTLLYEMMDGSNR